ncbi:MAG: PorV/PorQ family protein [candidate division WOR-3 bacterium]
MVKRLVLIILFSTGSVKALTLFEFLGGQKIGTTTMTFLKIPVGAKQGGLGETGVAIANDATSLYWNPAAMSFVPGKFSSSLFSQRWIGETYFNYGAIVYKPGTYSSIGFMTANLHSGYIERTDENHPFGLGTYYRTSSYYAGLSYSRKLIDRFSFGITLKYLAEILDEYSQHTVALDLGTFYLIGFRDIALGISISNIGPDPEVKSPRPSETPSSFSLPVIYRLGIYGSPVQNFYSSFQLEKSTDNVEIFRIGFEYVILEFLSLRAGYRLNANIPGEFSGFTAGIGFMKSLGFKKDFHVDYALSALGYAGIVHKAQVGVNF